MKKRNLCLLLFSILFLIIVLGTTKVNAVTNTWVFGITESLDIATTLDTDPSVFGEYGIGEPAITKEDFAKIEVKQLIRGRTYIIWDGNTANKIDNCTLSVNNVKFGTLEQTNTKLWGNFQGDGDICAYILKVDENAILPTESNNGYYSIDTSIEGRGLLLADDVTLINKEVLNTNTITTENNSDVKIGVTGKISSKAKVVVNKVEESSTQFETMETALTKHITKDFDKYDNKILFVKDIKIENGDFEGKLTLSFDVGTEYNNKKFVIAHQKSSNNEIEYFNGIITNGKATIEVTEFSPFAISVLTERVIENDNIINEKLDKEVKNDEKDVTPKTGIIENIYFLLSITMISILGIVSFRNKYTK